MRDKLIRLLGTENYEDLPTPEPDTIGDHLVIYMRENYKKEIYADIGYWDMHEWQRVVETGYEGEFSLFFDMNARVLWCKSIADCVSELAALNDVCVWREQAEAWVSQCGAVYQFLTDGPNENGHSFCHRCGSRLVVDSPNCDSASRASMDVPDTARQQ